MDTIRTELDKLTDQRLDYVWARSVVNSDAEGYRGAGIPKATFYAWSAEEREKLNGLAQILKRETVMRAAIKLQDAAEEAANVKIAGLKSRDERIRQAASTEILNRSVGMPVQQADVQSSGDITFRVVYADKKPEDGS